MIDINEQIKKDTLTTIIVVGLLLSGTLYENGIGTFIPPMASRLWLINKRNQVYIPLTTVNGSINVPTAPNRFKKLY